MRAWVLAVFALSPNDVTTCVSCVDVAVHTTNDVSNRYAGGTTNPPNPHVKFVSADEPRKIPLADGDVLEEDASGHVSAIRHATSPPTWTRFKPGATSPGAEPYVLGEIDLDAR